MTATNLLIWVQSPQWTGMLQNILGVVPECTVVLFSQLAHKVVRICTIPHNLGVSLKLNFSLELPTVEKLVGYAGTVVERNHMGEVIKVANTYVTRKVAEELKKVAVRGH